MTDSTNNFFSKVSTRKDRERVFVLLVESKSYIDCQSRDKAIFRIQAEQIMDSVLIVKSSKLNIQSKTDVILSFTIGQEKYFCKTTIRSDDLKGHFIVDLDCDLFKLQRRNSFRVTLPQGYNARAIITHVNNTRISESKFSLYDISGGGLAFEVKPEKDFEISREQIVEGSVEIGGKFSKSFKAVVRYLGRVGSQGSGLRKVGLEFIAMSSKDQNEIIKIVMDIHRDMFSKFKLGSR